MPASKAAGAREAGGLGLELIARGMPSRPDRPSTVLSRGLTVLPGRLGRRRNFRCSRRLIPPVLSL